MTLYALPALGELLMPPTEFGKLLKSLRKERRLSQKVLGEKVGVTYVAIGDWERGKRNPLYSNVKAVATALDVPVGDLLEAAFGMPGKTTVDDPDLALIINAYESATPRDKRILKTMAEQMGTPEDLYKEAKAFVRESAKMMEEKSRPGMLLGPLGPVYPGFQWKGAFPYFEEPAAELGLFVRVVALVPSTGGNPVPPYYILLLRNEKPSKEEVVDILQDLNISTEGLEIGFIGD